MVATHIYPGDIWLAISVIMIPVEFLTGTTIAIGTGIACGFTGVLALMSFGVLNVLDQFMIFFGLMALIQSGAYLLYKQRVRSSDHET